MKYSKILIVALLTVFVQVHAQQKAHNAQQPKEEPKIASARLNITPNEIYNGEEDALLNDLEADDAAEEDHPSSDIYEFWTNEKVNPYKVPVKELTDLQLDSLTFQYVHPLDSGGRVTSNFGPRRRRFHYGIDLKVYVGQDIYAAFDGKVRVTGFDRRGYGNYVVIRHKNGLETLYGHLSEIKVEANQDVEAGEVIALGGNTGRSTGPHLHFEFRYLGNAINPKNIVNFEEGKPLADHYLISKNTSFREIKEYQRIKYHTVRRGDTLSGIAVRYGTTVTKLCKLNGIKRTSTLRPKQRLRYS